MWFFHQSIRNPRGSEKSNGISNKVNLGDATGTGCWVYRQRTKRPLAGSSRELQGAGTGRASAAALSQERPTCAARACQDAGGQGDSRSVPQMPEWLRRGNAADFLQSRKRRD